MSRKSEVYFGRRVNNSTPPKKYQPRWLLQFTRNTDDAKLYIFMIITSWLQQRSTLFAFPQIANKLTGREPLLLPWLATSIPGLCVSVLSTNFSKGQVDEEYSKKVKFQFLRRQFISSVRSSNGHLDHTGPRRQHSLSEPLKLYQRQSLDSSAGYKYTLWVQQDITAR